MVTTNKVGWLHTYELRMSLERVEATFAFRLCQISAGFDATCLHSFQNLCWNEIIFVDIMRLILANSWSREIQSYWFVICLYVSVTLVCLAIFWVIVTFYSYLGWVAWKSWWATCGIGFQVGGRAVWSVNISKVILTLGGC